MSVSIFGKITVIKRNGSSGSQYPVTNNHCTFGRDADCEIRIQLPTVSDKECELRTDENGNFILTKVNQEGEIFVNGENIDSDATINHNDILTIAGRSFRFEYPPTMMDVGISEEKMKPMATPKNNILQRVKQTGSRRVSFGPQLSPEQFAAFMPPDTPIKRGAIPLLVETPKETKKRQSVLKETIGTPIAGVKNIKRKSVGKKPSPKLIKKQDVANTKDEHQCSFNDLVAMVGLDNVPKSGKSTPARKSNATPIRSNAKTPIISTKATGKKGQKDGVMNTAEQGGEKAGKIMTPGFTLVDELCDSAELFGTQAPTQKLAKNTPERRKSGKVNTSLTIKEDEIATSKKLQSGVEKVTTPASNSSMDDTIPIEKTLSSSKKRRSSVKMSVAGVDENEVLPYEEETVKTSTKKRKSSAKIVVEDIMDQPLPYEEETIKTSTKKQKSSIKIATPVATVNDGVQATKSGEKARRSSAKLATPKIDKHSSEDDVQACVTPVGKRKSLIKKATPNFAVATPGQDSPMETTYSALDDTVPYIDSPAGEIKTPDQRRKSIKTPKSAKRTPAQNNDVAKDNMDDTVQYIDLLAEKNQTPSIKQQSIATPKSAKATPKSAKATPKSTKVTPMSTKATPKSAKPTPMSAKTTPMFAKATPKSVKNTPMSTKVTPQSAKQTPKSTASQEDNIIMDTTYASLDDTVPYTESEVDRMEITNSAMDNTVPYSSPVLQSKSSVLRRKSAKSMTPSTGITTPAFKEPQVMDNTSTPDLRKSLKNKTQKPFIDTPRPKAAIVQNTTSALDETVPYVDSPKDTTSQEKRKSTRIASSKSVNDASFNEDLASKEKRQSVAALDTMEVTVNKRKSIGKTPKSAVKGAKMDDSNIVTPKTNREKTPKSSSKKTPKAIKNTEATVKTPKSQIPDSLNEQESPAKNLEIKGTASGRKSLAKVTPKSSTKKSPKQIIETPISELNNDSEKFNAKKTPLVVELEKIGTPSLIQSGKKQNTPGTGKKVDSTPKRSEKKVKTPKSSNKKGAEAQITEEFDDLDSSYQELGITKKETPARKSFGKITTPKSSTKSVDDKEMVILDTSHQELHVAKTITQKRKSITKTPKSVVEQSRIVIPSLDMKSEENILESKPSIAPGRKSVARKTPRRSAGTRLVSRKSITKSSKRQSLRIKRKSGVLLWSEIVRKNTDKQPESKQTNVPMLTKVTKRGGRNISKTPKQLREMRHIDSPATIYIGRRTKRTGDLDMTPMDFDMSADYSSEESFFDESSVEENIVEQVDVKESLKAPKVKSQEVKEHFGTKRIFKTPREKKTSQQVTEKFGTKRIFKTPKNDDKKSFPVVENFGTKRIFNTPRERVKNLPVEEHFGTKRLLQTPRGVRSKSIDGDFCIDLLHNVGEEVKMMPSSGGSKKKVRNQEIEKHFGTKRLLKTPKSKVRSKSIDGDFCIDLLYAGEEVETTPSSGETSTTNKEPVQAEIVKEIQSERTTRNKKNVTSKIAESVKADEISTTKRSTRKRKQPAHLDDGVASMTMKKVKSDALAADIEAKVLPKRSGRARRGKETEVVSTQKKINGNTENLLIENDSDKPKKSTRKTASVKAVAVVLPTKRSTRGKVVKQTLEVIAEQDETKNLGDVTEKQPKTNGRSKKNVKLSESVETVKTASRSTRGKLTTIIEEVSITTEKSVTVDLTEISATTSTHGKRATKVTTGSDKEIIEPTKKQVCSRSRKVDNSALKLADSSDEIEAATSEMKRPSRSRKNVENTTENEVTVTAQALKRSSRSEMTSMAKITDVETEAPAPKRSTRTRKPSKEEASTNSTVTEQDLSVPTRSFRSQKTSKEEKTVPTLEVVASAPKRSNRAQKISNEEKITSETEKPTSVPKRSSRTRKPSKEEKADVQNSKSENNTVIVEPVVKRSSRTRKPQDEQVIEVPTKKGARSQKAQAKPALLEIHSENVTNTSVEKTSRKRKTPDSTDTENAPKRRNRGNADKENEIAVENISKRSTRAKKAAPTESKVIEKSKGTTSNTKELVPVRKSSRSTRKTTKA